MDKSAHGGVLGRGGVVSNYFVHDILYHSRRNIAPNRATGADCYDLPFPLVFSIGG